MDAVPVTSSNTKDSSRIGIDYYKTSLEPLLAPGNEEKLYDWLKKSGLISKQAYCSNKECENKPLKWSKARVIDKYNWVCIKCKKKVPIRNESFLADLKTDIPSIFQSINAWCYSNNKYLKDQCDKSNKNGINKRINTLCSSAAEWIIKGNTDYSILGGITPDGEDSVVLVDVFPDGCMSLQPHSSTSITKKVLCVADTSYSPARVWTQIIENYADDNYSKIVQAMFNHVKSNSILVTNHFFYSCLKGMNCYTDVLNMKSFGNFDHVEFAKAIKNIEIIWSPTIDICNQIQSMNQGAAESLLLEHQWRQYYASDCFRTILLNTVQYFAANHVSNSNVIIRKMDEAQLLRRRLNFSACYDYSQLRLLEGNLRSYGSLMDDPSAINNYADYIGEQFNGRSRLVSEKWVSGLRIGESVQVSCDRCSRQDGTASDKVSFKPRSSERELSLSNGRFPEESKCDKLPHEKEPPAKDAAANIQKAKYAIPRNRTPLFPPQSNSNKSDDSNYRIRKRSTDVDRSKFPKGGGCEFRTARAELRLQNPRLNIRESDDGPSAKRKSMESEGRAPNAKFAKPFKSNDEKPVEEDCSEEVDERLKNFDPKMIEMVKSEIMDQTAPIGWDDIAGLEYAKSTIQESVVWPLLRPDIFKGLRQPPKGVLLFGPPGTGKTLIGKCVASQSKSTFFSISASSITSKWVGDGEKMVRALFAVARCHQPAVVFIDEIDSLLSQRSTSEHESSRRIKTEFMVQLDGATTGDGDRILIIGATNRPQELDEAVRRRLVKRLYIPLPDNNARYQIISRLMEAESNTLSEAEKRELAQSTDGYSGADMKNLCKEASLGPIRSIDMSRIATIRLNEVRPVNLNDFQRALNRVKPSVSLDDLKSYVEWNKQYGCSD